MNVWLLDVGNGAEYAFSSIEKAYSAAHSKLIDWSYDFDTEEGKEVLSELKATYDDPKFSGFFVDDLLWCWEVELI